MNKEVVIKKIRRFLQEHSNFKEECDVVYLLTEIRKILEAEGKLKKKCEILNFYCCWVLHIHLTKKSARYISDKFNKNIGVTCMADLKEGMRSHDKFFKLEDLRAALKDFFTDKKCNLPQGMLDDDKKWRQFKKCFLKIIAECPIELFDNFKSLLVEIKYDEFIYRFVLKKYFKNDKGENKNIIKIKIHD